MRVNFYVFKLFIGKILNLLEAHFLLLKKKKKSKEGN